MFYIYSICVIVYKQGCFFNDIFSDIVLWCLLWYREVVLSTLNF